MKKKRRYRQAAAFLLAAVLILSTGTGSPVFAEAEETEPVTGQEQVTEPVTEIESSTETETVTGDETTGESELITEPVTETETDAETEPVTESETAGETLEESEPETEPVTETESETQNMPPAQVQSAPPEQNQILEDSAKTDEAVQSVQELIDALTTAEELKAMSLEEQQAVYEQVQAAYDAYNALTDEQKEQITGAEVINDLFDVFNGMVALAADNFSYSDTKDSNDSITRTYTGGSGDSITISASDPATFNINAVVFNIDGSLTVTNSVSIPSWNVSPVTVSAGNLLIGGDFTAVTRILIEDGYVEADNISVSTNVASGNLGIIINGGIVKANSISVYNTNGNAAGTQNLTINGNAVVFVEEAMTNTAGTNTDKGVEYTKGVVFTGNTGIVYGSVTLPDDVTIPEGYTLTIPSGASLTVPNGTTLTNKGTITVENGGTFTNNGTIKNYGTINGTVGGTTPQTPATVSVTVNPATATYGSTVTLTANVTNATDGTVNFYQGTDTTGAPLNSAPANVSNGTATYDLALTGTNWKPGTHTITAVYSGGTGLLSGSDDATLTVSKGTQATPPAAPIIATATTNSVTLTAVSGENIEYGYTTGTGGQPGNWQTETTFNNLSAGTDYTFYTRYAETDYYEASDPSTTGLTVTTQPEITTTSLNAGYVGVPYNETLEASAASGKTVTWALASNSTLPAGLTLNNDGTITGTPEGTVANHNFIVQATIQGGASGSENLHDLASLSITINAGTPDITANTYNGEDQTSTFTYGDTITVRGTIAASTTAPGTSTNAMTLNQVGLYLDETELATADVESDGSFALTYDTSVKSLSIEEDQTLTVRYGGSSTLNSGSTTVTVTLNKKPVTVTFTGTTEKVYDGDTSAPENLTIALSDGVVVGTDDVTVTAASVTYDNATPDTGKTITASGLTLGGADKDWYVLPDTSATTTGTIRKANHDAPIIGEGYTIDYEKETITAESGYELGETSDAATGSNSLDLTPGDNAVTVYIRFKETSTHNESDWTAVTIPARPAFAAPAINFTNETIATDDTMEYRIGGSGTWETCSENMGAASFGWNGISEVKVQFRLKAVTAGEKQAFVSAEQEVTIPARPVLSLELSDSGASRITVAVKGDPQGADVSYQCVPKDSSLTENWVTSGTFEQLKASTDYTVYAKCAATEHSFSSVTAQGDFTTKGADYTVSIPSQATAGGKAVSISITEDTAHPFDLGYGGQVNVKIKDDEKIDKGMLTLTREGASNTITSALYVGESLFEDLSQNVATFTEGSKDSVSLSFAAPTEKDILAGTYKGTVNFEISYTQ